MFETLGITDIGQLQRSFKQLLDGLSVSLDLPTTFSDRFGFDPFTISSLSKSQIGRTKGALLWRDIKEFIELLAGSEEAAIAILNVFYPQVEDAETESESSSQSEDSSSA